MASQQQMRRENKTHDHQQNVDQVTHFESLTVMNSGTQPTVVHRVVDTVHGAPTQAQNQNITATTSTRDVDQHVHHPKNNQSPPTSTHDQTKHHENTRSTDTRVDVGRKGENTATAGKTTAEYAGKAAGVMKDAAVVAERETATGAAESMESVKAGVSGIIEGAAEKAMGFTGRVMDVGKKGAVAGKDVTLGTGKTAVGYVGKGVGAVSIAVDLAGEGLRESMESLNAGVGTVIEVTAVAAEKAVRLTDTAVDAGIKGTRYTGETILRGAKDVTLQTGNVAKETSVGVRESMEGLNAGVGGVIEGTAVAAEIVGEKLLDVAKKGAETVVAGTLNTAKTAAGYVGKATEVAKDATLVAGWSAAELAGDTATGLTTTMESLNAGVGGLVEGTALATEEVAQDAVDAGKKGASYVGEKVVAGKDVTLETTTEYARKAAGGMKDAAAVAGWSAAELARETATGVTESMENLNAGVAGIVEATALATEKVGQKTIDTVMDAGKKGASYVGGSVIAGKDVALETGKATGEYVGKAAGVVKDTTLLGGRSAIGLASDTAAGVTESMEHLNAGVAGLVEGTALATQNVAQKTFNTMADVGKKGASYIGETAIAGKNITSETGKATAEYVGRGASVVKDAAMVGGWSALELASDTTKGVAESMENVNVGVEGFVESAAVATEEAAEKAIGLKDVAVDMGKKGASYMRETGVAGKDITLETGKTTTEYVGKAANVVKDATLVAGWGAAKLASGTAKGVTESLENLNAGVAGLVEGTALATEGVAQKTYDTIADVGKKGASVGEKTVTGAMEAGKTAVGKAVDVPKGATLASAANPSNTRYFGAETKPKKIVVEKEEITIDFGQRRDSTKESKKEQGGHHR